VLIVWGGPKMSPFVSYTLILTAFFKKKITVKSRRRFVITLSLRIPPQLKRGAIHNLV